MKNQTSSGSAVNLQRGLLKLGGWKEEGSQWDRIDIIIIMNADVSPSTSSSKVPPMEESLGDGEDLHMIYEVYTIVWEVKETFRSQSWN